MELQDSTEEISEATEFKYAVGGTLIAVGLIVLPLAPLWLASKIHKLLKRPWRELRKNLHNGKYSIQN